LISCMTSQPVSLYIGIPPLREGTHTYPFRVGSVSLATIHLRKRGRKRGQNGLYMRPVHVSGMGKGPSEQQWTLVDATNMGWYTSVEDAQKCLGHKSELSTYKTLRSCVSLGILLVYKNRGVSYWYPPSRPPPVPFVCGELHKDLYFARVGHECWDGRTHHCRICERGYPVKKAAKLCCDQIKDAEEPTFERTPKWQVEKEGKASIEKSVPVNEESPQEDHGMFQDICRHPPEEDQHCERCLSNEDYEL